MMNENETVVDNMKLDHVLLSTEGVVLRRMRTKFMKRIQRMGVRQNLPTYEQGVRDFDNRRRLVGIEARYVGLARAFVKDMPYRRVENKTREGNEVLPEYLQYVLDKYGYQPDTHWVERWLHEEVD